MGTEDSQQADTLGDELAAAWDASESDDPPAASAAAQSTETTTSEEEGTDTSAVSTETDETSTSTETDETDETSSEEEEEDPNGTITPPEDWPQDWADRFRKLDDNGRQVLLDAYRNQQADYTRKTQEVAEIRKAIPDETKQQLQLNGVSEGQYMQRLAAADRYLQQSPQECLKHLAEQYGVDLNDLSSGGSETDYSDPEISRLKQEVTELRTQLQQREQREQQSQEATVQQEVTSFAQEKDDQGNLKHPNFEDVRPHMGALLQSGAASSLHEAYEQAVWARPELRKQLLEQQQAEQQRQSEASRKKKAAKAKNAATPSGSGTTATETEQPDDLRTALEKQFDDQAT